MPRPPFRGSAAYPTTLAGAVLLLACSTDTDPAPPDRSARRAELETSQSALYGKPSTYWNTRSSNGVFNVCWDPATVSDPTFDFERGVVEDAVKRNWARFARLNAIGENGDRWETCSSPAAPGLHVRMSKDQCGGSNSGLGTEMDGVASPDGLRIPDCDEVELPNNPACPTTGGPTQEQCLRRVTLHEFGHGIGFFHEEERSGETHPDCNGNSNSGFVGQKYGAYNNRSVMSECDQPFRFEGFIGPPDIAAVQRAYGRRIPGSLLSPTANCLEHSGHPYVWQCDETGDLQEWDYTLTTGTLRSVGSNVCLRTASCSNGAAVVSGDCSASNNSWRFSQVAIRGFGLCMDLAAGNTAGGLVQGWECLGNGNQRWSINTNGEIRFAGTSKCVTVPSSGEGQLTVTNCVGINGSDHQKFTFDQGNAQIRSRAFPTKCIDLMNESDTSYLQGNGLPNNGSPIHLHTCRSTQTNQKWNFSGQIVAAGISCQPGCLTRNSTANGSTLTVTTCNGSDAQVWDYYPL
jgi:hypothetical protein